MITDRWHKELVWFGKLTKQIVAKRDKRLPIVACKVIAQHDWCVAGFRWRLEPPNCARRVDHRRICVRNGICAPAMRRHLFVSCHTFRGHVAA